MAPSTQKPVSQQLAGLAKGLQFWWFSGHFVVILCVLQYLISWMRMRSHGGFAQFCYRTGFLAAAGTYGVVTYKTLRLKSRSSQARSSGLMSWLADENILYLFMSVVWLFMPCYSLAILPYTIYSVFHVATYTRSTLIPILYPAPEKASAGSRDQAPAPSHAAHALTDKIGWFVKQYYSGAMSLVATLETVTWVRLVLSALLFRRRSWILLCVYTGFLRARYSQSSHIQNVFASVDARVNDLLGSQSIPPAVRTGWDSVKNVARQFHDATDMHQYMPAAAPPSSAAKKST